MCVTIAASSLLLLVENGFKIKLQNKFNAFILGKIPNLKILFLTFTQTILQNININRDGIELGAQNSHGAA